MKTTLAILCLLSLAPLACASDASARAALALALAAQGQKAKALPCEKASCDCGCAAGGNCTCASGKKERKPSPCSTACTCGCNEGQPCTCGNPPVGSGTQSRVIVYPAVSAPTVTVVPGPVYAPAPLAPGYGTYFPAPTAFAPAMGGFSGGSRGCAGGG